jgi:hypothetical protein
LPIFFLQGLYGGKKTKQMLLGIFNRIALWKLPLSSTITLNFFGLKLENSSRYTWKLSVLQAGRFCIVVKGTDGHTVFINFDLIFFQYPGKGEFLLDVWDFHNENC